jgi:hypothetical protein
MAASASIQVDKRRCSIAHRAQSATATRLKRLVPSLVPYSIVEL